MMGLPIYTVDAFTDRPFAGNPAGVCLLNGARDDAWMRAVAAEMNQAETAFLVSRGSGANDFDLRWFSPVAEVDLCGHATLAAAHVLWERRLLPPDQAARFHTRSGVLTAERRGTSIELDFLAEPAVATAAPTELMAALGIEACWTGRNRLDYLVEAADEATVLAVRPDFRALAAVATRGVIVTAPADASRGADFVSRFFCPSLGVDEDAVTGSAHCCLGPFWRERLGRDELVGYQASPRGGTVRVGVGGDRVLLAGQAVTVVHGELV